MIKDKILKALNKQINEELYSSYAYLAMSAHFKSESLDGFAHWYRLQSEEEYGHAMKILDYINDRHGKVTLMKIDPPKATWKAPVDIFKETFDQEVSVSKSINGIVELSLAEKDYATNNFMQWFVSEQVEEESTALKLLDRLKLIGDNKNGLIMLDRELGMRASAS
ncbi:MAG: ferritin [Ignavibacteria bacterium GWA2_35_9]|nr:MAG: ferritin [Ignavibacteria bacterium GWA2_35_9]OGU43040.1 MAG: ferritin [Ignavibacteria bacterium GWB2_36_8]OGU52253.1 MAG: ferritin [Ignavibacteria bacterium GWC2_36_12]